MGTMSPTSSHNGSSRTFRASQGLGGKTGNAARRSYPPTWARSGGICATSGTSSCSRSWVHPATRWRSCGPLTRAMPTYTPPCTSGPRRSQRPGTSAGTCTGRACQPQPFDGSQHGRLGRDWGSSHHGRLGRMRNSFPEARDQSELRYCRRSTPAAFEFGPSPSYTHKGEVR
jgi:hypothetical protein